MRHPYATFSVLIWLAAAGLAAVIAYKLIVAYSPLVSWP